MNADFAKKIVSWERQKASYASMYKRGVLQKGEFDALVASVDADIARLRSQTGLELGASPVKTETSVEAKRVAK